ncbi:MAG: tetratricopeptide (TPR) repeat protein [Granulosicoccus sp.]|jgi:tetratricopeptide (TPR) repeat protein
MSYQFSENQWGERYIDCLNRQTFVNERSEHYFSTHLDIDFSETNVFYIVVGCDSGLLIQYFQTHMTATGTRAVFVEPDDIHETIIAECADFLTKDGTPLSNTANATTQSDIRLHSNSRWSQEVLDGGDISWFHAGEIRVLESLGCQTDYTQNYLPLFKEIRSELNKRLFDVANELGSKTFASTQIINAADNLLPLLRNPEFGKGHTAVILGGGPSLDTHLDWVIENRDKLFVIAISRLCSKLRSIDFKPDVVVSIDPYHYSYDVSKHGVLWDDVPLLCGYHVAPQLLQEWQGPRYFLGTQLPWVSKKSDAALKSISAAGPTVSHTATVLASQLGFTQILLTGVDLCYSSVTTHAKGSPEAAFQTLPSLYDAQVETYDGAMAGTQYGMQRSVHSLEQIGTSVNEFTNVLFNLSEHAVRIACIPHIKTSDVQLAESKADFSEYAKKFLEYDYHKGFKELAANVSTARSRYHFIKRSCQRAQRIIDRMYSASGKENPAHYTDKLDKIDRKIENRAADYMYTIKYYQSNFLMNLKKPSGFNEMKDAEMEEWIRTYYKILSDGAEIHLTMITDLEFRLQLRQAELERTKNIEELIELWKVDSTPGRVLQFSDEALSQLSDSDIKLVKDAKSKFLESIHNRDTVLSRKLKSYNMDIDNCMRSLTYLFNIRNKNDLQCLSDNLVNSDWPGNVLRSFAIGLIEDIDTRHENAIKQYQLVIDACSDRLEEQTDSLQSMQRIIEESLVRITQANLKLNQPDAACTTLGTLCEMLPQYIMAYAKLLNLCGNTDSAIEILSIYIEHYPTHWQAAQLMADILATVNRQEEAELASQLSATMRKYKPSGFKKAA